MPQLTVGEHLARCAPCPTCGARMGQGNPCRDDRRAVSAHPDRLTAARELVAH